MDHIADQGEEGPNPPLHEAPAGFASLWSDMPRDVMESVHLSGGPAPAVARLTMGDAHARVEIRITPRPARGAETATTRAHHQPVLCTAEEEDQTP